MYRALAVVFLALLSAGAVAAKKKKGFQDEVIAGVTHEVDTLKWRDEVARTSIYACASSTPETKEGCVKNNVRIHNDSTVAVQCHVTLEFPANDENGKSHYEADVVVFAGSAGEADFWAHGPIAFVPNAFTSDCVGVPVAVSRIEVPEECRGKLTSVFLDEYYPRASLRREEQGDAWIEYGVEEGNKLLLDVRVIKSSGFQDLDSAAIKAAKSMRTMGQCPGRRYQIKVGFWLKKD